jgi:hypothetical protein
MAALVAASFHEPPPFLAPAAVADGTPRTVVDYVPVYSSPCGMGFAYWDMSA